VVSRTLARLGVVAAAALFSTGGAVIKSCTLSGVQVACLRSGVAALVLVALFPKSRAGFTRRSALVGVAYASTLVTFVLATKLTTAASAIFLQSTAPLYLLVLAPWLLGERARRSDLGFAIPLIVGLGLLLVPTERVFASAPQPTQGNVLGLLSGVAWASTLVGLRWLGRGGADEAGSALPAVILGNAWACLLCLPFAFPISGLRATDAMAISYLGTVQIGLAYVLLTASMKRVPVFEASLLLFVEPVLNPVWTWLAHGERPGTLALLGGALVLTATAVHTAIESRNPTAPTDHHPTRKLPVLEDGSSSRSNERMPV
jgi:DME family drug/metabolite transporter